MAALLTAVIAPAMMVVYAPPALAAEAALSISPDGLAPETHSTYTFPSKPSGYADADNTAITVTINNDGDLAATGVGLSGTTNFAVSPLSSTTINPSGTATFTVKPNPSLPASNTPYEETITINGTGVTTPATLKVLFTVTSYDFSYSGLTSSNTKLTIPTETSGYTDASASFTITNAGNAVAPTVTAELTGSGFSLNDSATVNSLSLGDIAVGAGNAKTVPVYAEDGLSVGTHPGTLIIKVNGVVENTIDISFTVSAAQPSTPSFLVTTTATGNTAQGNYAFPSRQLSDAPTAALTFYVRSSNAQTITNAKVESSSSYFLVGGTVPNSITSTAAEYTITPAANIPVGTHTATIKISGEWGGATISNTFTVSLTVAADGPLLRAYDSSTLLSSFAFGNATEGYTSPGSLTFTVYNEGNGSTSGSLTVSSSNTSFVVVTQPTTGTLNKGDYRTATIRPATGLSNGLYTATITVSAPYNSGASTVTTTFDVTFRVGTESSGSYYERTLTHSSTGVSVKGRFLSSSTLNVVENSLHASGTCTACDYIRSWMSLESVIKCYNISSSGYTGSITVTIPVGTTYSGRQLTIVHCASGTLERTTSTVDSSGNISGTFSSLSPFAVLNGVYTGLPGDSSVDPPKTGDTDVYFSWGALLINISLLLAALCGLYLLHKKGKLELKKP